jgi:hypothetical protein
MNHNQQTSSRRPGKHSGVSKRAVYDRDRNARQFAIKHSFNLNYTLGGILRTHSEDPEFIALRKKLTEDGRRADKLMLANLEESKTLVSRRKNRNRRYRWIKSERKNEIF